MKKVLEYFDPERVLEDLVYPEQAYWNPRGGAEDFFNNFRYAFQSVFEGKIDKSRLFNVEKQFIANRGIVTGEET